MPGLKVWHRCPGPLPGRGGGTEGPSPAAAPPVLCLQHPGVAQSQLSTAPLGAAALQVMLSQNSCPRVPLSPQLRMGWVSCAVGAAVPSGDPVSPGTAQLSSLRGSGAPVGTRKGEQGPAVPARLELCSTLLFNLPGSRISLSSGVKEKLPRSFSWR